ncbi:antirestriction protein ArdA [Ruminococcaceae bacterium OttesenSCG-928-L11]|nr:antirestriction protein ArdA [Ruminococcaceae bacterium OttesenSCG-928-L11]
MSDMHREQESPIRAWLSYYIDGAMTGAWQNFPITREELEGNLGGVGVPPDKITEMLDTVYETVIEDLDRRLPRTPDLDELNYLAARIERMSEHEQLVFGAAVEANIHCGSLTELINLTFNPNQYELYPGDFSEKEFGGIMLEMHTNDYTEVLERLRNSDDPLEHHFADYVERLEASVDLVKYGRLAREAEDGVLSSNGYLLPMVDVPAQIYSGKQDIPAEYRLTDVTEPERKPSLLAALKAAKAESRAADTARLDTPEKKAPFGPEL